MNPARFVLAPRRLSALSLLRPLALIFILSAACLANRSAHAGTWLLTLSGSGSTSGGQKKPQSMTLPVSGTGSVGVPAISTENVGSTDSNGNTQSINPSATASLTVKGYWQPANSSDSAPPDVILEIQTAAGATGHTNDSNGNQVTVTGNVSDGQPDTPDANGQESGTHYRVEMVSVSDGSFTFGPLTPNASISATSGPNTQTTVTDSTGTYTENGIGFCNGTASVGPVTFSIVNGNWDGPYYFHYGEVDDGVNDTPWANNTVGATPSITDVSDSVSSFSLHNTAGGEAYVKGSITPVWFWNGPDLGVPPPPFEITVSASANCNDSSGNATGTYALDGIDNNPHDVGSTGKQDVGSEDVAVQVQSDEYAPGEGNGYWAIGPTVDLYASIFGNSPSDLESWVDLDASIESGLNN